MGLKTPLLGLDGRGDDVLDEAASHVFSDVHRELHRRHAALFGVRGFLGQVGLGRADEDEVAVGGTDRGGHLADAGGFDEEFGALVGAAEGFGERAGGEGFGGGERQLARLGAVGEGLAGGDVLVDALRELVGFFGQQAVELGLLPGLDGLGLGFVESRQTVGRALVEQDEGRAGFGAVDFGAPFLLGKFAGDAEGFGRDLRDGRSGGDVESGDGRDLGVLGLDPGGEFLAVGLGGIDREFLGEFIGDLGLLLELI